jgi:hypothetical protein
LDDIARERIAKGGKLCVVIVPADAAVAATYFGATESATDTSPKLTLDAPLQASGLIERTPKRTSKSARRQGWQRTSQIRRLGVQIESG